MTTKLFLLIMGDNYYPKVGDGDWVGRFETREEAESKIHIVPTPDEIYGNKFKLEGQENYQACDWYEIIDLGQWGLDWNNDKQRYQ